MTIITASQALLNFFQQLEYTHSQPVVSMAYLEIKDRTNDGHAQSYYLNFPKALETYLPDYSQEMEQILVSKGHHFSYQIFNGLLALICIVPKKERAEEMFNMLLGIIAPVKIKQYLFLKGKAENIFELRFLDYTIGQIDYERFAKFLENHTGSDYAKRYEKQWTSAAGIEVKTKSISTLDVFKWLEFCGISKTQIPQDVDIRINLYLGALSLEQFNHFQNEFDRHQRFLTAYTGMQYNLKEFHAIGFTMVDVFYGFVDRMTAGWVSGTAMVIDQLNFPDPDILKDVKKFIKKNDVFLSLGEGEYARYLETVGELFSNAERQAWAQNFNQAFIDIFVGLDFLLSPDTNKSKKLKRRIAFLVHDYFKLGLVEQEELLDKLYDLRSEYVHKGVKIDKVDFIRLRDISKVVIAVLFELHKRNLKQVKMDYQAWLEKIDMHLEQIATKNIYPTNKDLLELGMAKLSQEFTVIAAAEAVLAKSKIK
ncbi:hypothetical protein [Pedobacter nototheniae]|uniref:hypothetical protein n=1 Tax=Pedobacter nototheniae TaxID=2488994 RepID=UPI00103DD6B2|nr:hypothetical protein [Pedobacter nototheniae]